MPRQAYVEEVPDGSDAPPRAPTPPPNPPLERPGSLNVFDFLVPESRNASQVSLAPKEPMTMKRGAPSLFSEASKELVRRSQPEEEEEPIFSPRDYEDQGFSYGSDPVQPSKPSVNAGVTTFDFKTPTAKEVRRDLKEKERPSHRREDSNLSDRKRKRAHPDPLDISASNSQESLRYEMEGDTLMSDPPNAGTTPGLAHSGLTGGLNRLMTEYEFPPSPDYSDEKERTIRRADPTSPLKRTRHSKDGDQNGLGISIKGRAGRIMSLMGVAAATNPHNNEKSLVKVRRRASSSESGQRNGEEQRRPRKHHKVHRASVVHHGTSSRSQPRSSRAPSSQPRESSRKPKAIEYHYPSSVASEDDSDVDHRRKSSQLVKYDANAAAMTQNRSEHFLSFVNKGPDSEKGLSINKCLKRWHRDNADAAGRSRLGRDVKMEEEKELWRGLRLRRNDRGEVVVFF